MKIYIDSEYRCHTTNDNGNFREVETDFFDGRCATFVEGYRFVPSGEIWTRTDGSVFRGELATPWKPHSKLDAAQREYERQLIAMYEKSLETVGVVL